MTEIKEIELFAPATIANVSCGFDVLGCCLDSIGDRMVIRRIPDKGIRIKSIRGGDLPLDPDKNVVGAAIKALIEAMDSPPEFGFELEITKGIKPGSGIGSSAASSAGAVYRANILLGSPFSPKEMIPFAAEGERLACGSPIADNVAPALLGGFTLVQTETPIKVLELPVIDGLHATVIHPQIEIRTEDSRAVLPEVIAMGSAIRQWANLGALVHALHTADVELFASSLQDHVVEKHRSKLIPKYAEVKRAALEAGALGCGISGSGPSIFAFSKDHESAVLVKNSIEKAYRKTNIPFHLYTSAINVEGIKILNRK